MKVVFSTNDPLPSQEVLNKSERALLWIRIFALVCQSLTLLYPLQSVLDLLFSLISKRPYQMSKFELIINFGTILTNILIISQYNPEEFASMSRMLLTPLA